MTARSQRAGSLTYAWCPPLFRTASCHSGCLATTASAKSTGTWWSSRAWTTSTGALIASAAASNLLRRTARRMRLTRGPKIPGARGGDARSARAGSQRLQVRDAVGGVVAHALERPTAIAGGRKEGVGKDQRRQRQVAEQLQAQGEHPAHRVSDQSGARRCRGADDREGLRRIPWELGSYQWAEALEARADPVPVLGRTTESVQTDNRRRRLPVGRKSHALRAISLSPFSNRARPVSPRCSVSALHRRRRGRFAWTNFLHQTSIDLDVPPAPNRTRKRR